MAEFCKKCADRYGLKEDTPPFLCEGCGQLIEGTTFLKWILKKFGK